LPERKIVEGVATGGIGDSEVDGGVEVGCMSKVSGKHGECMLGGLPPFFDGFEGVDGKGMAKTMGSGWSEEDIAQFFSCLSNSDLSDGTVEEEPDLLIRYRVLVFAGKQVWVLILGAEVCLN
jgi:hypothetical protein